MHHINMESLLISSLVVSFIFICFAKTAISSHAAQDSERAGRIRGGDLAEPGEFGYQAVLSSGGNFPCAGSFLFENLVVTAAHCVFHNGKFDVGVDEPLEVVGGTTDLLSPSENTVSTKVQKIYIPREFNESRALHPSASVRLGDIAILRLSQTLNFDENPELGRLEAPLDRDYANEEAIITAFGWNQVGYDAKGSVTGGSDQKLRFAGARVLSNGKCGAIYGNVTMPDNLICAQVTQRRDPASKDPSGVCRADSGGPLVHDGNVLIGVQVAGPRDCDESVLPGIYTRVSKYKDFIKKAFADLDDPAVLSAELKAH